MNTAAVSTASQAQSRNENGYWPSKITHLNTLAFTAGPPAGLAPRPSLQRLPVRLLLSRVIRSSDKTSLARRLPKSI